MTLEYWVSAEKWYHLWAPLSLGSIFLLILIAVFSFYKRHTKIGKSLFVFSLLIVSGIALVTVINNRKFQAYLEPVRHVTPLIRQMQYKPFTGYEPLTRQTIEAYTRYHDVEGIKATGLYQEEWVSEPVRFLGKKQRHFYFEKDGIEFKQYEASVVFDPEAKETAAIGTTYHLVNPDFETIGFSDTPYVFYDHLVIAEKDYKKEYEPEDEYLVPTLEEILRTWTF